MHSLQPAIAAISPLANTHLDLDCNSALVLQAFYQESLSRLSRSPETPIRELSLWDPKRCYLELQLHIANCADCRKRYQQLLSYPA